MSLNVLDLSTILVFIPTVFVLAVSPGPDLIFIITNSVSSGKSGGVASAFGCTTGAFVHGVLAAFGLTAIITIWQPAYELVRVGGAVYLAYLGVKMCFSKSSIVDSEARLSSKSMARIFRQGLVTNLMNPKAILFSMTFLPQFTNPGKGPVWIQMIVLAIVLSVVMLSVLIPIALTGGLLGAKLIKRKKSAIYLNRIMGGLLITLSVYVFRSRRFVTPN